MPTAKELKALVNSFDWDKYEKRLHNAIDDDWKDIAVEQAERDALSFGLDFAPDDPFYDKWFTGYLGDTITGLLDSTRDMVKETLQSSVEAGVSTGDLSSELRDAYAFSPSRSLTIARTEGARAAATGQGLLYQQNGIENVEISDGDGDEECANRDGTVVSVEEWLDDPLVHPNCTASASPVLEEQT